MALVQKQTLKNPAGLAPVYSAASAGGDTIPEPGSDLVVHIKAGATGATATFATPGNLANGEAYPDKALVVPANSERFIALGVEYRDSNGQVAVTWSQTSTITFAAFSC